MRKLILRMALVAFSLLGAVGFVGASAYAVSCDATTTAGAIQCGTDSSAGVPQGTSATSSLDSTVKNVINILSIAVGAVAVVMIIIGGFRYITSGGEATKVTSAKNTLLYAIIGLAIVVLAQTIVHFVIDKSIDVSNGTSPASAPTGGAGGVNQGGANSPH